MFIEIGVDSDSVEIDSMIMGCFGVCWNCYSKIFGDCGGCVNDLVDFVVVDEVSWGILVDLFVI